MREEISRILAMVEDGTLTGEQATEMIAALKDYDRAGSEHVEEEPSDDEATTEARVEVRVEADDDDDDESSRRRHGRHRRHRHRARRQSRRRSGFESIFEEAFGGGRGGPGFNFRFDDGTIASALKSGLRATMGFEGDTWVNDTNDVTFAKAATPTGNGFRVENNQIVLSNLADLELTNASFSKNELHAGGITNLRVEEGSFDDNALRGSSLKSVTLESSDMLDNEWNGAQIRQLTLGRSSIKKTSFNGTQIRDLGLSKSKMKNANFNGAKLKNVVIKGNSNIKGFEFSGGMGSDWLVDGSEIIDSKFKGVVIAGLQLDHAVFENCRFTTSNWSRNIDRSDLASMRDATFKRVALRGCKFVNCRFDHATFRDFEATDLEFDGVDFSDMTIETAEALEALATRRNAA